MNLIQIHKLLLLVLVLVIIIMCEIVAIYTIFGKETVESGIGCVLAVFGIIYIDMITAYAIDKKTNIIDKIFNWIDK